MYSNSRGSLKYSQKRQRFEEANVSWNPSSEVALSYDWWIFVRRINGKLVYNNFSYSPTTSNHQSKVFKHLAKVNGTWVMSELFDLIIEAPRGLQDLPHAVRHYENMIMALNKAIEAPRSQKRKNEERMIKIQEHFETIDAIKELMGVECEAVA